MKRIHLILIIATLLNSFAFDAEALGPLRQRRVDRRNDRRNVVVPRPAPPPAPVPFVPSDDTLPDREVEVSSLQRPIIEGKTVSWEAAYLMARISNLIYSPGPKVESQLRTWGFDVRYISLTNAAACVAWNDEATIIAFCGTDDAADLVVDMKLFRVAVPEGLMHLGFYNEYMRIEQAVIAAIPSDNRERKLWLTGHSLGGAMAAICGYSLSKKGINVDSLATFGQPMFANKAMANFLTKQSKERCLRFVNERDIIPRVPPAFYHHYGRQAFFSADGVNVQGRPNQMGAGDAPVITSSEFVGGQGPLTVEEFERLKQELRATQPAISERYGVAQGMLAQGSTERAAIIRYIPYFEDHRMVHYVEKVLRELNR